MLGVFVLSSIVDAVSVAVDRADDDDDDDD